MCAVAAFPLLQRDDSCDLGMPQILTVILLSSFPQSEDSPYSFVDTDAALLDNSAAKSDFGKSGAISSVTTERLRDILVQTRYVEDMTRRVDVSTAALKREKNAAAKKGSVPGGDCVLHVSTALPLEKVTERLRQRLHESTQGVSQLLQTKRAKLQALEEIKVSLRVKG